MIPPESRFLQEKKYNIEKQIEQIRKAVIF